MRQSSDIVTRHFLEFAMTGNSGRNAGDQWTAEALQRGDLQAIRQRALAEPDYLTRRDFVGSTPLQTVIDFGELELVEFLLTNGADPNVEVDDGYSCLLSAVESEAPASTAIVAALIAAGANIHQTGAHGWSPLHMAAAHGYSEKARLLIDAGADVNQRTVIDGHETPLMAAAFSGRPETVQLLLDHGADPSLRDIIHNRTALDIARYTAAGPDPNVYEILKQENIQIDFNQLFAGMDLPDEFLPWMQENMAGLDMAENYVKNSAQIAATGNHAEVVRLLEAHPANG
jgi:ankyrin repeat protein